MPRVLSENQIIFQKMFQDQMKQELQFVDDVANGRASERVGFDEKALGLLVTIVGTATTVGGAAELVDDLGLTDLVADSVEALLSFVKDQSKDEDAKILKALMWVYHKNRIGLDNVIDESAKMLAIQMANIINRIEKDSIPLLVHGLVLRVLDYCTKRNLKDAELNISELMLKGAILGSSGAFNEGFRNVPLELLAEFNPDKSSSTKTAMLKKVVHHHAFTVEGVGRTGFVYTRSDDQAKTEYLSHERVERGSVSDKAKNIRDNIAARIDEHGAGRAVKGTFKAINESKSNYTKVSDAGDVKYGFIQILRRDESPTAALVPYTATATDVENHQRAIGSTRLIHVNQTRLHNYLISNAKAPKAINDYFNGIVVLDNAIDFSKEKLDGANFSGAILSRVNMQNIKLDKVNFSDATLVEINLNGATMTGCNMSNCNLGSAQLVETKILKSDLTMANFSGANCTRAEFVDIQYLGSRWDDAKLVDVSI